MSKHTQIPIHIDVNSVIQHLLHRWTWSFMYVIVTNTDKKKKTTRRQKQTNKTARASSQSKNPQVFRMWLPKSWIKQIKAPSTLSYRWKTLPVLSLYLCKSRHVQTQTPFEDTHWWKTLSMWHMPCQIHTIQQPQSSQVKSRIYKEG